MRKAKITHHDLTLSIKPETSYLHAVDTLQLENLTQTLTLHLGKHFTIKSVVQNQTPLKCTKTEENRHTIQYRIRLLDQSPLTIEYDGYCNAFTGYGVTIITADIIELSGFGFYFPTVEKQSQLEAFTYQLNLDLSSNWQVVCPDDETFEETSLEKRSFSYRQQPLEDIFICASKTFVVHRYRDFSLVLPDLLDAEKEAMIAEYDSVVDLLLETFGDLKNQQNTVAVVSPRGEGAQEWGYERAHMWVIGDVFLRYAHQHDWVLHGLKKSLSMHETIHAWIGIGVKMSPYMKEAITQYLEVVLTETLFQIPDLSKAYFTWYQNRFSSTTTAQTKTIKDLTLLDNHYNHWYLKGALAFHDLEKKVSRACLLESFTSLYEKYNHKEISDRTLIEHLGSILNLKLDDFYYHWFEKPGLRSFFEM